MLQRQFVRLASAVVAALPVVSLQAEARAADARYWDADAYHYDNNFATGAGMGGTGTWGDLKWSSTVSGAPWSNSAYYNAVFWGDAGEVTLDGTKTPGAITFKTDSYALMGGSLQFAANQPNTIDVQAASATIITPISSAPNFAPIKTGPGTLYLAGNVSGDGAFNINQGTLSIDHSSRLNDLGFGRIIINGGTLQNTALERSFIGHQHVVEIGPLGATFDIPNPASSLAMPGKIEGIGRTLIKSGAGTFNYSGDWSTMHSKLKVTGGWYQGRLVRSFVGPGIMDAITLDGGGLRVTSGTEANQGITVASGGGTIDVSVGVAYSGPLAGSGTLNIRKWPGTQAMGGHYAWMRGTGSTFDGPINVTDTDYLADDAGAATATAPITLDNARMGNSVYADLYAPLRPIIVAAGGASFVNLRTMTVGSISGVGDLAKPHNGGTVITDHVRVDDLSIAAGAIAIKPGGGDDGVSHVNSIVVSSGQFDLRDSAMVVDASGVSAVEAMVAAGRNGGAWNGAGIVTSETLAASQSRSLAVASAGDALNLAPGATTTWRGRSVDSTDVLVAYTHMGDANLSGVVDADDYFQLDSHFASGPATWFNGDFDYSGAFDADDYFLLDAGYARQFQDPAGGVAAVPEPTGAALALGALGVFARRARRIG